MNFAFGYSGTEAPAAGVDLAAMLEGARVKHRDPKVELFLERARFDWEAVRGDASKLCERFHYSHFLPSSASAIGVWRDGGELAAAACCFGGPPTRVWSHEPMMELTRLVRREGASGSLTQLVAQTVKAIRKAFPDVLLLLSYADRTEGHTGWVYQAASWHYSGVRSQRVVGFTVDGKFVHNRTASARYGCQILERIQAQEPGKVVEPVRDEGKHVYWKPLRRGGDKLARKLNLDIKPYPKEVREGSKHIERSEMKEPDLDERL